MEKRIHRGQAFASGGRVAWRRWLGLLAATALLLVLTPPTAARAQDSAIPVAVDAIAGDPGAYVGRTVTVQGQIGDVLGPGVLKIDSGGWFAPDVLVVADVPADRDHSFWTENDQVQVTGIVRVFHRSAFERELGLDLSQRVPDEWEGRPVIYASEVRPVVALGALTNDPLAFLGRQVTVRGNVAAVRGERAFLLDTGGWFASDLPVVLTAGAAQPAWGEGDRVQVTGTVGLFERAPYERETGSAVDDQLLAEWEGTPVLFARSVEVVRVD